MTAIVHAPGRGVARSIGGARRMARITWYRHRWAVVAILGVFGAATAVLLTESIVMRAWIDAHGIARCLDAGSTQVISACGAYSAWPRFFSHGFFAQDTAYLLLVVPPAAALCCGLPWLTREFETGSFRYTWVQGISPVRWLLGVSGSMTAVAAAAAAACGAAADWWYQVAQWPVAVMPDRGWGWDAFGLSPIALVGWTVFAMALAMLSAAAIRRTVPAMAAFAITYAGILITTLWWVCPRLLTLAPVVRRERMGLVLGSPHWNDLFLNWWLTGPDGHVLTMTQTLRVFTMAGQSHPAVSQSQWITAHHYGYWIAYQPHTRLVLFQLVLGLALLALSALSVLVAVRLLRRQRP